MPPHHPTSVTGKSTLTNSNQLNKKGSWTVSSYEWALCMEFLRNFLY